MASVVKLRKFFYKQITCLYLTKQNTTETNKTNKKKIKTEMHWHESQFRIISHI